MHTNTLQIPQRGSALVECVILCTLMLPLFLLLVSIGNIIDIKQATIQASRYAAWEQTVTPGFQAPPDIKARFYAHANQSLLTFDAGGGHYLNSNSGNSGVAVSFGKSIRKMGKALEYLDSVDWSIEGDGVVDAGVQVNIVKNNLPGIAGRACNGQFVADLFGCVSAHNTIMVDGWGVAGNKLAEQRTRALVPAAALARTGKALSRLGKIPFLEEFKGLEKAFGHVDSTVLPVDRYTGNYREAVQ